MADTFIAGASATVALASSSATLKFFAVSVNSGQDLIDVSHFGNSYRTRITGLKDLAGTMSGYAQTGNATDNPLADISGTITITFSSGCSISFTGVIGNRQIGTDVNGAVVYTFNYANTSDTAPSIAWA